MIKVFIRLIWVLTCFSACSAAPKGSRAALPNFPIGMYGVENPQQLKRLHDAGFDCFQSYTQTPHKLESLALAARRQGMRMLIHPHELIEAGAPPNDWPLAAWYLQDEPDVARTLPAQLSEWEKRVRDWSPNVPTAFVVGIGTAVAPYVETGDAIMVDWYPVPHLPLESAGQQIRQAVANAQGKPVWAVLQAMDWRDYPQRDPKKKRIGRFPNIAEIRFMSYHSVLEGARGIWFFSDSMPDGSTLGDRPELWSAVAEVSRELRAMTPIFARGRAIPLPFQLVHAGPLARAWTWRGRDYLVILNPSGKDFAPVPDELLISTWRPLFEVRRNARELLENRLGIHCLKPYQVMVFESRVRLSRLLKR